MSALLPPRGLYRTAFTFKAKNGDVPAGRLVLFHPSSKQGPPLVIAPTTLRNNRWEFGRNGALVNDEGWCASLIPLRNQGYYRLGEDLLIGNGNRLPETLLVHLSYTPNAEALIFPAQLSPDNSLRFLGQGVRISDLQMNTLTPAGFRVLNPKWKPSA